jgi:hypothetical protein
MTESPFQKYIDALDNKDKYVQPALTPQDGQYLLKALDYLTIYSVTKNQPDLIEQPLHENVEDLLTDVIIYAPEKDSDG